MSGRSKETRGGDIKVEWGLVVVDGIVSAVCHGGSAILRNAIAIIFISKFFLLHIIIVISLQSQGMKFHKIKVEP